MEISKSNITIDLDKSKGSMLVDKKTGKKYLDLMSMYSSLPLGYNSRHMISSEFTNAILRVAAQKVCNCEYDSEDKQKFLKDFEEFVNHDNDNNYDFFHFACTGALAVEHACKVAIDYTGKKKIVSFGNSFHGITSYGNILTDRVGGTKARLEGFFGEDVWPRVDSVSEMDELVSILRTDSDIAGVLIEPIRCTNGDIYFKEGVLESIFQICEEFGVLSIVDEIQTGFGATGNVWYTEGADILVFGKKSQVSGFMTHGYIGNNLDPIRYCVTWDGNLVDMVRSRYIMKGIKEEDLLSLVKFRGEKFLYELKNIKGIENARGKGYILAFDLKDQKTRDEFYKKAFENGLLVNLAGENSIRLRPNLAITPSDIDLAIELIKKSL